MRHLPNNKSPKQNIIISACFDYYGPEINAEETKSAKKIALWTMGRKKGISLTEQESSDLWAVKINLADEIYVEALQQPPGTLFVGV